MGVTQSPMEAVHFLETRNFTEPAFVFVIMVICATRPILSTTGTFIDVASRLLPLKRPVAFYATCLVIGPSWEFYNGARRDDSDSPDFAGAVLQTGSFAETDVRDHWSIICEHLHWWHAHAVCRASGIDGSKGLELGFGFHANPFRLEGSPFDGARYCVHHEQI